MTNAEPQEYMVVTSQGNIEIRDYSPMILAEVEAAGERKQAISEGFKILADYIFGNNVSRKHLEIAPSVTGEKCEKIAMTAPVMQQKHADKWKVRFVMPTGYSLETLPVPNCKEILLLTRPAKRLAVIRFSGTPDDETLEKHTEELKAYIARERLNPIGRPIMAFYNRPSTPPSSRRNEVMIEIDR